jgi:hypothetical protein
MDGSSENSERKIFDRPNFVIPACFWRESSDFRFYLVEKHYKKGLDSSLRWNDG